MKSHLVSWNQLIKQGPKEETNLTSLAQKAMLHYISFSAQ